MHKRLIGMTRNKVLTHGGWNPHIPPIGTRQIIDSRDFFNTLEHLTPDKRSLALYRQYWDIEAALQNPSLTGEVQRALTEFSDEVLSRMSKPERKRIEEEQKAWKETQRHFKRIVVDRTPEERISRYERFIAEDDPERVNRAFLYNLEDLDYRQVFDNAIALGDMTPSERKIQKERLREIERRAKADAAQALREERRRAKDVAAAVPRISTRKVKDVVMTTSDAKPKRGRKKVIQEIVESLPPQIIDALPQTVNIPSQPIVIQPQPLEDYSAMRDALEEAAMNDGVIGQGRRVRIQRSKRGPSLFMKEVKKYRAEHPEISQPEAVKIVSAIIRQHREATGAGFLDTLKKIGTTALSLAPVALTMAPAIMKMMGKGKKSIRKTIRKKPGRPPSIRKSIRAEGGYHSEPGYKQNVRLKMEELLGKQGFKDYLTQIKNLTDTNAFNNDREAVNEFVERFSDKLITLNDEDNGLGLSFNEDDGFVQGDDEYSQTIDTYFSDDEINKGSGRYHPRKTIRKTIRKKPGRPLSIRKSIRQEIPVEGAGFLENIQKIAKDVSQGLLNRPQPTQIVVRHASGRPRKSIRKSIRKNL